MVGLRRWVIGVLIAYAVIAGGLVAFAGSALRNAQSHLNGARAELRIDDVEAIEAPNLESATDSLGQAHKLLANPLVWPLKLLPVAGRQLRAIQAMAGAAHTVLSVGADALDHGRTIALNPTATGPERVRAARELASTAHTARGKLAGLSLGPSDHLVGPVAKARRKLVTDINRVGDLLTKADIGANGLAQFMAGPSRYLVLGANPSEMRAGSGIYLSAGTLAVQDGVFFLSPMKPVDKYPQAPNSVPLDPDVLRLWGAQAPGAAIKFANVSPRFPATGALLQRMWAASGQPPVDGVLVVDPQLITNLLGVLGPQPVGKVTLKPEDAMRVFMHDQFLAFTGDELSPVGRREFLGDATRAVFNALNTTKVTATKVGRAFGDAAAGRHLLAWTSDPSVQAAWSALGMDGTLPDASVLFALQNRGANQLDYFQQITARPRVVSNKAGSDVTIVFAIHNAVTDREPRYIAGPIPGLYEDTPGLYTGFASISLPKDATNVSLTGGLAGLVAGPDGNTQVVSQWVHIARGETVTLRLTFHLPSAVDVLTVEPSSRIPGITWIQNGKSWIDTSAKDIRW